MRWRTVILGGGAALAAAAALNAAVAGDGALPNPLGGEEGAWRWRGHRIAWTRRGSGPAVLLVHAIHAAAWSYEWRHAADRLAAAGHTVWTLDLLGFGRSDRPAARYSAALYVALLDDFAREVVAAPCALVGSSLGGTYAVALAARDADRFPALVLVCPTGVRHLTRPPDAAGEAARTLLESPIVGEALFNALVSGPSLRHFLARAYADAGRVTPALVDAHHAAAHQPGARFAPAAFVGMGLSLNVRDALRRLEQPLLVTWGEQAREVPATELDAYRALRPDAEVATFAPCGSLPHDERAEEWCARVTAFLARTPLVTGAPTTAAAGA